MRRVPGPRRAPLRVTIVVTAAGIIAGGCSAGAGTASTATAASSHCPAPHDAAALGATGLERAYGVPGPTGKGPAGTGAVIAWVMPYLSPDLRHDVGVYSARYHLPAPEITMVDWHNAPPADKSDPWQAQAIEEGTADAEMAHAMAPGARLVYVQTPAAPAFTSTSVADGTWAGLNLTTALAWTVTHVHPDVISLSEAIPEPEAPTLAAQYLHGASPAGPLMAARSGLKAAAAAHVTVVAASSDTGGGQPIGKGGRVSGPAVAWPASDPLVTAVGGTWLHATAAGARTGPGTAWTATCGMQAGGGGRSAAFSCPAWQDPAAAVTGSARGVPDISMSASPRTPSWVYITGNTLPGASHGWNPAWGTSLATPLFAGIVADAAALAGHPLGLLGPALYGLHGPADGLADVTSGTTSIPGTPGWPARTGYDLATGIGTVTSAAQLVRELAATATGHTGGSR